ncbi:Exostosin family protein [Alteromonas mediterranea MED64]|uniref:exostosin domain-containing protein n=1 Tax=Alteromonas mediterranea TaxID=314275 RepID=UPI000355609F|nr:exostosin family protein [Alteromonas mediterranea]AGP83272.1 Exostosin family protein [Alteromonas mediterranea MED64]
MSQASLSSPFSIETASNNEMLLAYKNGTDVFSFIGSFRLVEYGDSIYSFNLYEQKKGVKLRKTIFYEDPKYYSMCLLVPPLLSFHLKEIFDKPNEVEPLNFWQYPCSTERQAFQNHRDISVCNNIDSNKRIVNIYLALPWATYIDKSRVPRTLFTKIKNVLGFYKYVVQTHEYDLKVHTVCQHIHWQKMESEVVDLGVTDFHLSHKLVSSAKALSEKSASLKLHGWPLIAVNYVTPELSSGLKIVPISERRFLASFVGAYMPHYRDDSRLQLQRIVSASSDCKDVVIKVNDEWHFNKQVYEEQVQGVTLHPSTVESQRVKTVNYNRILSESKYSLCPQGAGPNTLRIWESIAIGCIPVIFSKDLSIFQENELGKRLFDLLECHELADDLFKRLRSKVGQEDVSKKLIEIYKKFESMKCF